jgi:hypothetical protein
MKKSFCLGISICAPFVAQQISSQQMIQSTHALEYLELLLQQLGDPPFKFM